jgi:phosphoglycerate kinase
VDFNVPLEDGTVADDTRIRAALPTLEVLMERKARIGVLSHMGRPKGKVVEGLRMNPVADRLAELIGRPVKKMDDCIGAGVREEITALDTGQVLLLENVRFHPGEKANEPGFAKDLASPFDLYVNDAFGASHRAHASTVGVTRYLPAAAGLLMERELETLGRLVEQPERPFVALLGGAKISDKIKLVENLLCLVDFLLMGGGMANTFLMAQGCQMGDSLVEDDALSAAAGILDRAGQKLVLPEDMVVADAFDADAARRTMGLGDVAPGWRVLDIGPATVKRFGEILHRARTVLWNGPMGVFEMLPFAEGTMGIARLLSDLDATTVVGGGDSVAAVDRAGVADRITHVSTGGGAMLTFLEGTPLPGVEALDQA